MDLFNIIVGVVIILPPILLFALIIGMLDKSFNKKIQKPENSFWIAGNIGYGDIVKNAVDFYSGILFSELAIIVSKEGIKIGYVGKDPIADINKGNVSEIKEVHQLIPFREGITITYETNKKIQFFPHQTAPLSIFGNKSSSEKLVNALKDYGYTIVK